MVQKPIPTLQAPTPCIPFSINSIQTLSRGLKRLKLKEFQDSQGRSFPGIIIHTCMYIYTQTRLYTPAYRKEPCQVRSNDFGPNGSSPKTYLIIQNWDQVKLQSKFHFYSSRGLQAQQQLAKQTKAIFQQGCPTIKLLTKSYNTEHLSNKCPSLPASPHCHPEGGQ